MRSAQVRFPPQDHDDWISAESVPAQRAAGLREAGGVGESRRPPGDQSLCSGAHEDGRGLLPAFIMFLASSFFFNIK